MRTTFVLFFGTLLFILAVVLGYLAVNCVFEILFVEGRAPIATGMLAIYGIGTILCFAAGTILRSRSREHLSEAEQSFSEGWALLVTGIALTTVFFFTFDPAALTGVFLIAGAVTVWTIGLGCFSLGDATHN